MTRRVELLLVRHGNTFGPGDPVVWVGRREDLPLVESGRAQARALGAALVDANWQPTAVLGGELKRQREHLELAAPGGQPILVRPELNELDYGAWGGLSTDEIEARFGRAELDAWNERSVVPAGAEWPESLVEIRGRVRRLAAEIGAGAFGERVLACSSNGLIRWFLDLVPGGLRQAIESGDFKVKTGHTCRLEHGHDPVDGKSRWSVLHWNRPPDTPLEP